MWCVKFNDETMRVSAWSSRLSIKVQIGVAYANLCEFTQNVSSDLLMCAMYSSRQWQNKVN